MSSSSSSMPPYSMCSKEECEERQKLGGISEFEATFETHQLSNLTKRVLDSNLAVQKYRRSAAGDTKANRRPVRLLTQLLTTWRHLSTVYCHQTAHYNNPRSIHTNKSSLLSTVSFVDDRVRAIQVDLVISQQACSEMQLELIRYHVLSLYLLSQVPRKQYEPKFARQALWTALSAYWNQTDGMRSIQDDDKVLCYTALLHVASCLLQEEGISNDATSTGGGNTAGYGAVLLLALKRRHTSSNKASLLYPRFQWALQLTAAAQMGLYYVVLSMLTKSCNEIMSTKEATLCRCCMVPALNVIRMGAIRHYNKSFGKREAIDGTEMARLLILDSAETALRFCANLGLPIEDGKVIMKATCVSVRDFSVLEKASRKEDSFVFGETDWLKVQKSAVRTVADTGNDPRVDQDGVLIPPRLVLEKLVASGSSRG